MSVIKKSEIMELHSMIEYQKDAVVSKTLIKETNGNITLFAFDKGQELSEHTSPYDALVYVYDGTAEITISGKAYQLGKNEMIIMPANEPHALKAQEQFKMMLVMIKS